MKNHLCAAFVGIALLQVHAASMGQGTLGRSANDTFSGEVRVVNALPVTKNERAGIVLDERSVLGGTKPVPPVASVNLGPVLQQFWQQARPEVSKAAEAFLHERHIGNGFRTSANHLALATHAQLFTGWDGRGFTVRVVLPGNKLSTRIRVPGPSAQSSDPALTLPFDLDLVLALDVAGTQLNARSATLAVKAYKPDGRNPTGDAGVALADLIKVVGGPDLIGALLKQVNGQKFSVTKVVNQELTKLNAALAPAARAATVRPGFDKTRRAIVLTIERAQSGPIVR